MRCLLFFFLVMVLAGCRQEPPVAGFRTDLFYDSTRAYQPSAGLPYRPVDADIWYPAFRGDSVLVFGDFLQLLEKRANFFSTPQRFSNIAQTVSSSFAGMFHCSDSTRILSWETASYASAKPISGQHPLILYLASYNGMGYENYPLLEALAREGYLVASLSSIGRYPGDMTMKNADLMEQVMDAEVLLDRLRPQIDTTRIAVMGYSWGGLAAAMLSLRRPEIRAVVSLDGSEFHHYGQNKTEDHDFQETAKLLRGRTLPAVYLRLQSGPLAPSDSVYAFSRHLSTPKDIRRIDSAGHEDFSCFPTIVRASGGCSAAPAYPAISRQVLAFFRERFGR